jgi:hypothetical protein
MDYAVIVSAIVLGLSVLATLAKFLDWFIHSDPKTMVRTSRWMLLLLVLACIPVLIGMIVEGQWSGAMLIAAVMLVVPTALKWRVMFAPLRAALSYFRPKPQVFDMPLWEPEMAEESELARNPEMVRRAAAILEAYVSQAPRLAVRDDHQAAEDGAAAGGMLEAEALEVLGLEAGADESTIRAAHRRLIRLVHPDHCGSTYLSRKVHQAKDVLLPDSRKLLRPFKEGSRN